MQNEQLATQDQCPFHNERKTDWSPPVEEKPDVEERDGVWYIYGYEAAKTILRSKKTRQAGFQSEQVRDLPNMTNEPVLFLDGEAHRIQRKQTARFFTPSATNKMYHQLMSETADELISTFEKKGEGELSTMSLIMAVKIAAHIVGLTNSNYEQMTKRIIAFTESQATAPSLNPKQMWSFIKMQWFVLRFFLYDVRPAIKERQKEPQNDLISYLLTQNYTNIEILTECITYGTAGMVTTREFISVATWHLLENKHLYQQYIEAEEEDRYHILHELLRLEPIIALIERRTTEELIVPNNDALITIPAGALIKLDIYAVNSDESVTGAAPHEACPVRQPNNASLPLMSFGDGHHRCPGAYVAIQETDLFLQRLFKNPKLKIKTAPTVSRNMMINGYELRNFILSTNNAS